MTEVNSEEYSFFVTDDKHGNKTLTVIKGHPILPFEHARTISDPTFFNSDCAKSLKNMVDSIEIH